jgi:hypothetical protein
MGLMYLLPTEDSPEEIDGGRVEIKNSKLTLKSYGLPMIFWGYLAAIFIVVGAMAMVSQSVIHKMLTYNDVTLTLLAYLVQTIFIIGPTTLLGFYFYEKHLIKNKNELEIIHRVFFIPLIKKKLQLDSKDSFIVDHFMESPNVAKMQNKDELRGFENKGYFELKAIVNGKKMMIDRCSRKADLIKIKDLLSKY